MFSVVNVYFSDLESGTYVSVVHLINIQIVERYVTFSPSESLSFCDLFMHFFSIKLL